MHLRLRVNGRPIHISHNVHSLKGLFACVQCGAMGTRKLQLLHAPCTGQLTGHSRRNLGLLRAGMLPKGCGTEWPLADPTQRVEAQLQEWSERLTAQNVQRQVALMAAEQRASSNC